MKVAIAAIMKNEAPYIIEWVAYHRVVGIDDFVIADNISNDGGSSLLMILNDLGYIRRVEHRTDAASDVSPQLSAYDRILGQFNNRFDWIGFIDADEFLTPTSSMSVKEAIAAVDGPQVGAIAINWATFGSSAQKKKGEGLIIERFTQRAEREKAVNHHFKAILKTSAVIGGHSVNPHFFKINGAYIHADGSSVMTHPWGAGLSQQMVWSRLRLNHYVVKSVEEYKKKIARGDAMSKTKRDYQDFFDKHDTNDETETFDKSLIEKTYQEVRRIQADIQGFVERISRVALPFPAEPERPQYHGHIDAVSVSGIAGWAVDQDGNPCELTVEVNGDAVSQFSTTHERDDLQRLALSNGLGGFSCPWGPLLPLGESRVIVRFPNGEALYQGRISLKPELPS